MYDFQSPFFRLYQGIYAHSSEFPPNALALIPEPLRTAIDEGNAKFFAELKDDLPRFYHVLVEESSPVHLLERRYESDTLSGDKREHKLYCWGLECAGIAVVMRIPVPGDLDVDCQLYEPYFQSLPTSLHGCYAKTDGMAISDQEFAGTSGYDLPTSFSDWRRLVHYCEDVDLPEKKIAKMQDDFSGDDLRVYIQGSHGDLILLNFTRKDRQLYHVQSHDFDHYALIEDVPSVLDEYFAYAVRGFPTTVNLRRKRPAS
jgi:hypothetical protein